MSHEIRTATRAGSDFREVAGAPIPVSLDSQRCNPERRAMRTNLHIDERLLEEARRLTGIETKAALVNEGLRALVERERSRKLAALGGSAPRLRPVPRRQSPPTAPVSKHIP